jgi:hypothetical protein
LSTEDRHMDLSMHQFLKQRKHEEVSLEKRANQPCPSQPPALDPLRRDQPLDVRDLLSKLRSLTPEERARLLREHA